MTNPKLMALIEIRQMRILTGLIFMIMCHTALSQSVVVSRNARLKEEPFAKASDFGSMAAGDTLKLISETDSLGYFHVEDRAGRKGWIFNRLGRRIESNPSWWARPMSEDQFLTICSFNIKWLGSSSSKNNEALVGLIKDYDIIAVQEVVAPPYNGRYCDGVPYEGIDKSAVFFDLMENQGFLHYLSCEDTGNRNRLRASSASEWFVVFYKPEKVRIDSSRTFYISEPRAAHPVFDRVPHRFHFQTLDATLDFSLISVHLASDSKATDKRKAEMDYMAAYAESQYFEEKDFIILGDMNIQNKPEFEAILPAGWMSLNADCRHTNVSGSRDASKGKPYDHVFYHSVHTYRDIDQTFPLEIPDLYLLFHAEWALADPVRAASSSWVNTFGNVYSDHHPIVFRMKYGVGDDD